MKNRIELVSMYKVGEKTFEKESEAKLEKIRLDLIDAQEEFINYLDEQIMINIKATREINPTYAGIKKIFLKIINDYKEQE